MPEDDKARPRLETAHVLFMDIVGYSRRTTDEQSEALQELNQIVRQTDAARQADAAGKLIILPTGDGMALVFTGSVEEPAECALELSHALHAQPSLPVRMGIHSGPVHPVKDANGRDNVAGIGINIAQRVMDCGDAGHILVSKRVADDLAQQRRWQRYLHPLGDAEVKHGLVISLVNLYAKTIGNPAPPARLDIMPMGSHSHAAAPIRPEKRNGLSPAARATFILVGLVLVLAIVALIFAPAIIHSRAKNPPTTIAAPPSPPSFGESLKNDIEKNVREKLKAEFAKERAQEAATASPSPSPSP
jgi:hypothetical protein